MKKINVSIFCDEIKNEKLDNGPFGETENWDYIGVCIVPTSIIIQTKLRFIIKNMIQQTILTSQIDGVM